MMKGTLWVGKNCQSEDNPFRGVFVLGHSTYGTVVGDLHGILAWIEGKGDATFSIFYRVVTGRENRRTKKTRPERQAFWDQFIFANSVEAILRTGSDTPSAEDYAIAKTVLPGVCAQAVAEGAVYAFSFGDAHQTWATPILNKAGLEGTESVHFSNDNQKRAPVAWKEFLSKLNGSHS